LFFVIFILLVLSIIKMSQRIRYSLDVTGGSLNLSGNLNVSGNSNTLGSLITNTDGNIGIGISNPTAPLHLKGILIENPVMQSNPGCSFSVNSGNGNASINLKSSPDGSDKALQFVNYSSGFSSSQSIYTFLNSRASTVFVILHNGDVRNATNSYGAFSDVSLKENIVDAGSQWNDIKSIKVRNFNLKESPEQQMIGVVAQELEIVSPGLVTEENSIKGVKYSVLYMKAVKALQEAMDRIEASELSHQETKAELQTLKTFLQSKFPGEF
jgi:hypothetical protein